MYIHVLYMLYVQAVVDLGGRGALKIMIKNAWPSMFTKGETTSYRLYLWFSAIRELINLKKHYGEKSPQPPYYFSLVLIIA